MTTHGDVPLPTLAADDPRISEWLDGRLPAAEAAAIERAVAGTPALAGLVADLRAIREAARGVPALRPPAGFTDRVLAAVASGAGPADETERVVIDEWRAVEAERIAAERVEAAADRAEAARGIPQRAGGAWPLVALAGALAAGLLLAVVLNSPAGGRREVALAPPAAVETTAAVRDASNEAAPPVAEAGRRASSHGQPIEVVVRGPEQRAELLQRITALGLIQTLGEGEGSGSPNLATDGVLELVGPPEAIAAFVSEITQTPAAKTPSRLREAEREAPGAAARSFSGGSGEPRAGPRDRGRTPERRLSIRIVELPTDGGESSRP